MRVPLRDSGLPDIEESSILAGRKKDGRGRFLGWGWEVEEEGGRGDGRG